MFLSIDYPTYLRHEVCMLTLFLQSRARGGHVRKDEKLILGQSIEFMAAEGSLKVMM